MDVMLTKLLSWDITKKVLKLVKNINEQIFIIINKNQYTIYKQNIL